MRFALALLLAAPAAAGTFTATEMMKLRRLADPAVSPDGKWMAYQATEVELPSGARNSDLYLTSILGGAPRRLTSHAKADSRPRFSPDGKRLAFLSNRDGSSQVYLLELLGGEPVKATALPNGADSFSWIDDRSVLVTSEVAPAAEEAKAGPASSARVYDELLFRHWDTWEDGKRTHLLVVPLQGGPVEDLTPGGRDVPPFSLGGPDDFGVSPDGQEVCFSRNDDKLGAISTNADLYVVPVTGGEARRIASHPGYDGSCRYSPDGSRIAFRAQMRAGYESDRWQLVVYDRAHGHVAQPDRGFRSARRGAGLVGGLPDALLHRRGRRPLAPVLGARGGRCGDDGPGRRHLRRPEGHGGTPRVHEGRAHPPRRDLSRGPGRHGSTGVDAGERSLPGRLPPAAR